MVTKRRSKSLKDMTYKQLKRKGIRLRPNADSDGDGVINKNDCRPLNRKKQGYLHQVAIKRLREKEAKLERKRVQLANRLETQVKRVKKKLTGTSKIRQLAIRKKRVKQALIDEINKERSRIRALKVANAKIRTELLKTSKTGQLFAKSRVALKKTKKFVKDSQLLEALDMLVEGIAGTKLN